MDITDVRIKKVNSDNKIKAIASVTFDNEFVVREIKVLEGRDSAFLFLGLSGRSVLVEFGGFPSVSRKAPTFSRTSPMFFQKTLMFL